MTKKALALVLAMMLIIPTVALVNAGTGFASPESGAKALTDQNSAGDEKATQAPGNNKSKGKASKKKVRSTTTKQQAKAAAVEEVNDLNDKERPKKEKIKVDAKELRLDGEDSATAKAKKLKKEKNKVKVTGKGSDDDSTTVRGSKEESETVKLTGIANAMSRIQRNIERKIAKAGDGAASALKAVVNKFASWLGLAPVYTDVVHPGSGEDSSTPGSDVDTGTVPGVITIPETSTVSDSSTIGS